MAYSLLMDGKHLHQERLRKCSNGRDVPRRPEERVNPMRKAGSQGFRPQAEIVVLRPRMSIEKGRLEHSQPVEDMHFVIIGRACILSEDLHCQKPLAMATRHPGSVKSGIKDKSQLTRPRPAKLSNRPPSQASL
jgi:hypothetical protein